MTPDLSSGHWPFADPPDTPIITLRRILFDGAPILFVSHDADDDSWQFLDGEHVWEDEAAVVSLAEIVSLDPTLRSLADLPIGWQAMRGAPSEDWRREAER